MRLRNLYEAPARKVVAIMPGGFHPFHPGHKSLYDWAVKTFGKANVYVAATADVSTRPFPFDIKKKLAAMAGVPAERFIQVKSPFNMRSYVDILDDDTALVFVRSVKDKGEQPLPDQTKKNGEPGYLRTYTGKNLKTSNEMGYMAYGPTINFNFGGMQIKSASELRATWPEMSDEDKLKAAKLMYGNGAPVAVKLLDQALGDTEAPVGEGIDEENKGLYYNVNKRKKAGTSRKKGHPKAPTDKAWKDAAKTAKEDLEEDIPAVGDIAAMAAVAGLAAPVMASLIKGAYKTGKNLLKIRKIARKAGVRLADRVMGEKSPPGREKQVKKLKGKFDDPGAPYAIAWAQHNKHGKPKRKSRG